jgi:F420-non-reducing hydrogenase large subunit
VKTINIQPVTRIEGGAKVTIDLDDNGNVADAKFIIQELRGFENFCIGRPIEEMPRITTRICGVCPLSHHGASAKACDAVFGVEPPPTGRKLRELANIMAFIEEHILHFYFLAGADFVMGPDADYSVRNVVGIANKMPEVGRQVVKMRHMGAKMVEILCGKSIHPVCNVPGGFSKPLTEAERKELLDMAKQELEFAKFTISYAKENIFPKYLDVVNSVGVIKTGFLGTVDKDGAMNMYDGKARLMDAEGKYEEFEYNDYLDYIAEHIEPWAFVKFPYAKKAGKFSMDLDNPVGIYRTNTLARANVADKITTPLAQKELAEFRETFGRPVQQTLLYNWARLIELLYSTELVIQLLNEPDITGIKTRVPVTPRAARGVGVVEAPRGTLIHDYTTDDKGMITKCNLIVGTTHNNGPINMSVKQAAQTLIKNGVYDETILNEVEMSIRAYDPCLSCASHNLDGRIALNLEIKNSDGEVIDNLTT